MRILSTHRVDPTFGVFGSAKKMRGTEAGQALNKEDCCEIWVIVFQEGKGADFCPEWTSHTDGELATKQQASFSL
ncbi:hypothetical protein JTF12_20520 [Leclercia adecarboxylata]|uniref:hypothetical protein n=1 Tax=Leclercia adecarboxylata TaxID=83655 RepID=UPI001950D2EB|nr:hypothetical protein [Leclercia adecarboxylata]MBM6636716.1 hypothetical protein [Leclercia adecarboxylata]